MNFKKLAMPLLLAGVLMNAGAASAGTATGGNLTFSWDDAFWAGATASVVGNTLTFDGLGYDASVTNNRASWKYSGYYDTNYPVISVTASSGHKIDSLDFSTSGTYAVNGTGDAQAALHLYGDGHGDASVYNTTGSGTYTATGKSILGGVANASYGAEFWGAVGASGRGSSASITGDSAAFSFNVSPVPEPSAWMLMLSGFGMIGWIARRRSDRSSDFAA